MMMTASNFSVTAVNRTETPEGIGHGTWYEYVIEGGAKRQRITGCRCGSRDQVRQHAENFAPVLNERAKRGYSVFAPRRTAR
jgi:hypothetical protein